MQETDYKKLKFSASILLLIEIDKNPIELESSSITATIYMKT